jgi:hypothetical protein
MVALDGGPSTSGLSKELLREATPKIRKIRGHEGGQASSGTPAANFFYYLATTQVKGIRFDMVPLPSADDTSCEEKLRPGDGRDVAINQRQLANSSRGFDLVTSSG